MVTILKSFTTLFITLILTLHVSAQERGTVSRKVTVSGARDITFVGIPAGSFSMGSDKGDGDEKPVHTVSLDNFEMSTTEITQGQ
ncbi:formylglycine-generating enzyme family protein, partial [Candidatus Latescibacterota bacterium]